ncbi:TM2 domain-containing protein [Parapusillimonas granuli]|uniref:TM2 domain-containing protein n=1 Tax=Parapusillimonas granuli TaxID=380911 RepID=A0A853FX54_9BURK|nr:TM2 domain-containing protein [Parapusillimonas granuli]MBB5213423.1 TM2 domain-containing membrane protein YozV [Parapusillimonas granuli]MEB2398523.1 TM2 domain-containing protein [Alcaligenaceae bacterium]NYT48262.1 TM2 domain-containing protein [Parapusillimonas granuli]
MLQKIILAIAVFIVILVALTFGEALLTEAFAWISHLTGLVIHNFSDIYHAVHDYVRAHAAKVLLALLLTIPISLWIIKSKSDELKKPNTQRKIAIVLAVFLGWLGAHRFYLGQIGLGVVYLIIFYVFTPLVIVLALIDAVRYVFMSDDDFTPARI